MRASILNVKDTGMSVGALVFSLFTLLMINAIVILPAGLIVREFLSGLT